MNDSLMTSTKKGVLGRGTLTVSLFGLTLMLAVAPPALAQNGADDLSASTNLSQMHITVKGVVCSFCAYGTEKNLARLDFVDPSFYGGDGVHIDLEQATITLALRSDQEINFDHIQRAITKGGYVPVVAHLHLAGIVEQVGETLYIQNSWNNQKMRLLDTDGNAWLDQQYIGADVVIDAHVPMEGEDISVMADAPTVRVQRVVSR